MTSETRLLPPGAGLVITIVAPVSYTHLDVYKRQTRSMALLADVANDLRGEGIRLTSHFNNLASGTRLGLAAGPGSFIMAAMNTQTITPTSARQREAAAPTAEKPVRDHTLALTLSYNGAPFSGFARQPGQLTEMCIRDRDALLAAHPLYPELAY